ncbi:MAG TPA: hypothetical protein VGL77_02995 [Armatimonadota bacterium]
MLKRLLLVCTLLLAVLATTFGGITAAWAKPATTTRTMTMRQHSTTTRTTHRTRKHRRHRHHRHHPRPGTVTRPAPRHR